MLQVESAASSEPLKPCLGLPDEWRRLLKLADHNRPRDDFDDLRFTMHDSRLCPFFSYHYYKLGLIGFLDLG
jgi:hypothetical protein